MAKIEPSITHMHFREEILGRVDAQAHLDTLDLLEQVRLPRPEPATKLRRARQAALAAEEKLVVRFRAGVISWGRKGRAASGAPMLDAKLV